MGGDMGRATFAVDVCDGECRPSWIHLGDYIAKTLARVRNRRFEKQNASLAILRQLPIHRTYFSWPFRCGRCINANPTLYEICVASELAMDWL